MTGQTALNVLYLVGPTGLWVVWIMARSLRVRYRARAWMNKRKQSAATKITNVADDPRVKKAQAAIKPFDPLDPNADKGWCIGCDDIKPAGEFSFPEGTLLWLCRSCRKAYDDPMSVLNPEPEPSEPKEQTFECSWCGGILISVTSDQEPVLSGPAVCFECRQKNPDYCGVPGQYPCARCGTWRDGPNDRCPQCDCTETQCKPCDDNDDLRFSYEPLPEKPQSLVLRDEPLDLGWFCTVCGDRLVSGYGLLNGDAACPACADKHRRELDLRIKEQLTKDRMLNAIRQLDAVTAEADIEATSASSYCRLGFCEPCGDLIEEHELAGDAWIPHAAFCPSCRELSKEWAVPGYRAGILGVAMVTLKAQMNLLSASASPPQSAPVHTQRMRVHDQKAARGGWPYDEGSPHA